VTVKLGQLIEVDPGRASLAGVRAGAIFFLESRYGTKTSYKLAYVVSITTEHFSARLLEDLRPLPQTLIELLVSSQSADTIEFEISRIDDAWRSANILDHLVWDLSEQR